MSDDGQQTTYVRLTRQMEANSGGYRLTPGESGPMPTAFVEAHDDWFEPVSEAERIREALDGSYQDRRGLIGDLEGLPEDKDDATITARLEDRLEP